MTPPLTVEQVEVIRRLRNSGATIQQITNAYQILDSLDKDLGSFGLVPKDQSNDSSLNNTPHKSPVLLHPNPEAPYPQKSCNFAITEGIDDKECQTLQQGFETEALCDSSECNTTAGSNSSLSNDNDIKTESLPAGVLKEASKCYLMSLPKKPFKDLIMKCSSSHPTSEYFDPKALLKLNDEVSADAVQTFLSGETKKLDTDTMTTIIDWFSGVLCTVDWFVKDVIEYSKEFVTNGNQNNDQDKLSGTNDVMFLPRRERFLFHETHVTVMESNFQKNSYPSHHEKALIANECNLRMAICCGRDLQPRERVSINNVDGWFRNKRKRLSKRHRLNPIQQSPQFTKSKEAHRMEMEPSDIYVSEISCPPTPSGPGLQLNSQQTSTTIPPTSRPSVSIPTTSFEPALPPQHLTEFNSSEHSSSTEGDEEALYSIVEVKEEIFSDEENLHEEGQFADTEPPPSKIAKVTYTKERLLEAMKAYREKGLSQRQVSKEFGIPRSTLHDKLTGRRQLDPIRRQILSPEDEAQIVEWLKEMSEDSCGLKKADISAVVKSFLDTTERKTKWTNNQPGEKWLRLFRKRHPEIRVVESQ